MLVIFHLPLSHDILLLKIGKYKVVEYRTIGKSLVTGAGFELFENSMDEPQRSRKIPVEFS